jgi:hypothetical protein
LQESSAALVLSPRTLPGDREGGGGREEPLQERRGDHAVPGNEGPPVARRWVTRQEDRALFVAAGDQRKQAGRSAGIAGEGPERIDAQELGVAEPCEALGETRLGPRLRQGGEPGGGRGPQPPRAGFDGVQAQGHRPRGMAPPGGIRMKLRV